MDQIPTDLTVVGAVTAVATLLTAILTPLARRLWPSKEAEDGDRATWRQELLAANTELRAEVRELRAEVAAARAEADSWQTQYNHAYRLAIAAGIDPVFLDPDTTLPPGAMEALKNATPPGLRRMVVPPDPDEVETTEDDGDGVE